MIRKVTARILKVKGVKAELLPATKRIANKGLTLVMEHFVSLS